MANKPVEWIKDRALTDFDTPELQELQNAIAEELDQRKHDIDLTDTPHAKLVNGTYVKWADLSAHANLKAGPAWILQVTGQGDDFLVDGEWLDKTKVDGRYHMDVSDLKAGDIIKVSGASHSNKKHRYYRVVAITDTDLYYSPEYGLDEADVLDEIE